MKELIRQRARELGFDDCRFTTAAPPDHAAEFQRWIANQQHGEMAWLERNAHKRVEPQHVLAGAKSVIVLAVSYHREKKNEANGESGMIARYARFADYHDVIAEKLKTLTAFVDELGGSGTRSLWYVDTGPLLERDLAQRAGLGFVGKHTNLISRSLGNWTFLCEIITTLELEPDAPEHNHCGRCTRCLDICPTRAITAPFNVDARRCISYLTIELKGAIPLELRPLIGNRIYGCDDCLAVCPWNRFARSGSLMPPHAREDLEQANLLELLTLDGAAFKAKFAGTPILRTKRRGLLRNVCVALGNVGDERALPALEKALQDPEPLIREHAAWAVEQIRARLKPTDCANWTRAATPSCKFTGFYDRFYFWCSAGRLLLCIRLHELKTTMQIKTKLRAGFTLVEIMIVVAIIGLLAAIAIPNFIKARQASQKAACVANLKTIDGAKATWALEQRKTNTDVPGETDLFGPASYIREKPNCPANGTYSLNQVDAKPACSIPDHTF